MADFIRNDEVNLARYLPGFLEEDAQFNAALQSTTEEHEKIRLLLKDILSQFTVQTATWGLTNWEDIYELNHDESLTTEERRERLFIKLRGIGTITLDVMNKLVNSVVPGKDAVVVENVAPNAFRIDLNIATAIPEIREVVELYKPAHLIYTIAHVISTAGTIYYGFAISKRALINIKPPDTFHITVEPGTVYFAGIVQKFRKKYLEGV